MTDPTEYWKIADEIKRRLFGRIREYLRENPAIDLSSDYSSFAANRKKIRDELHSAILEEWRRTKMDHKDNPTIKWERIKGFLYEGLFYASSLDLSSFYFATDIVWIQKKVFEAPPHFEVIPLFGIIPPIQYRFKKGKKPGRVPQLEADFLVLYVEGKAGHRRASPVAFIDVKSSNKVHDWRKEKGKLQAIAALRHGCAMQIAYPDKSLGGLKTLKDWEVRSVCPSCGELMHEVPVICPYCRQEAYPFFREDWKPLLA